MRSPSRPGFVGRDPRLAGIVDRVNELQEILNLVRKAAPPELTPFCQGVAWSGTVLVVGVPFGAVATRLRLAAPAILSALQASGWFASAILPRVQVDLNLEEPPKVSREGLSAAAQSAFAELAQTTGDDGLRNAIADLLKHQKKTESGR